MKLNIISSSKGDILRSSHNCGFFSNCSVLLHHITQYYEANQRLPHKIDSSRGWELYRLSPDPLHDTRLDFFKEATPSSLDLIPSFALYGWNFHHSVYSSLTYSSWIPFIKKYFSPTEEILDRVISLENTDKLDYENTCGLYYRGTSGSIERPSPTADAYVNEAKKIHSLNPDIKFIIQSDEEDFVVKMKESFPDNFIYFDENIGRTTRAPTSTKVTHDGSNAYYEGGDKPLYIAEAGTQALHDFTKTLLAIVLVLSKCRYLICNSSNVSAWTVLYRGHSTNVIQGQGSGFIGSLS